MWRGQKKCQYCGRAVNGFEYDLFDDLSIFDVMKKASAKKKKR